MDRVINNKIYQATHSPAYRTIDGRLYVSHTDLMHASGMSATSAARYLALLRSTLGKPDITVEEMIYWFGLDRGRYRPHERALKSDICRL